MKPSTLLFWLLSILFPTLLLNEASAQTIYVNTSSDAIDFGGAQQVSDLPGPDGKISLPEAGLASDNTPGVQTIGFHIPQSEWQYQWLYPGRAVLKPFLGFRVFDTVVLDATTQTAFTGDTYAQGGEVVIWAQTYLVNNVGSVIRGFDNSPISVSGGSGNFVQGNTQTSIDVYDSPYTLIGGTSPGEGNTCGTIKIDRSNNNVVVGNTTTRVRVLGWVGGGQPATNNRIGGPTLAERNYITGYGTWSSEGYPGGTTLQIFDTVGTVVENNWIGTTPDGLAQGSQASTQGIGFEGENYGAMIRNNRIAGILGHGIGPHYAGWLVGSAIDIYGIGNNLTIVGNTIGLNANDQPLLGSVNGIVTRNYYLGTIQGVKIGGQGAGEGNTIAGHLIAGINVSNTYSGVRISGNSIRDNGGLGIDLLTSGFVTGVTPNDILDADVGGNGLQNFPVLQSATRSGNSLRILGTLNSTPSTLFTVEFFASPQVDVSGYGEGRDFLGSVVVTTDASGNAALDVLLAAPVTVGSVISATATATISGSTSEFSASVTVAGPPFQWTDLGFGLGGTNGIPELVAFGIPSGGQTITLGVSGANPNSMAAYAIGSYRIDYPLFDALLVPFPEIGIFETIDGSGSNLLEFTWPEGLPADITGYFQVLIVDPVAPQGWAFTNALEAVQQ
ncbi:MAG: hypothetical protein ACKVS6_14125 [Planctomycetota bacterium]